MLISSSHGAQGFPAWQVLVVDLRCHGESATIGSLPGEPHNVQTSAGDVLALLRQLKLFPEVLAGHSFGGKVVMSMAEQFGHIASRLPRPVQVRPCQRKRSGIRLAAQESERVQTEY